MADPWRSERNLGKSVLTSHHVGLRYFDGKRFYLLSQTMILIHGALNYATMTAESWGSPSPTGMPSHCLGTIPYNADSREGARDEGTIPNCVAQLQYFSCFLPWPRKNQRSPDVLIKYMSITDLSLGEGRATQQPQS